MTPEANEGGGDFMVAPLSFYADACYLKKIDEISL